MNANQRIKAEYWKSLEAFDRAKIAAAYLCNFHKNEVRDLLSNNAQTAQVAWQSLSAELTRFLACKDEPGYTFEQCQYILEKGTVQTVVPVELIGRFWIVSKSQKAWLMETIQKYVADVLPGIYPNIDTSLVVDQVKQLGSRIR